MTRLEKLLNKFLENPQSLKFKKIEKLMLNFGFQKTRINGSHHQFDQPYTKQSISIPIHNDDCGKIYKFRIAKLLNYISKEFKNDNETP